MTRELCSCSTSSDFKLFATTLSSSSSSMICVSPGFRRNVKTKQSEGKKMEADQFQLSPQLSQDQPHTAPASSRSPRTMHPRPRPLFGPPSGRLPAASSSSRPPRLCFAAPGSVIVERRLTLHLLHPLGVVGCSGRLVKLLVGHQQLLLRLLQVLLQTRNSPAPCERYWTAFNVDGKLFFPPVIDYFRYVFATL